MDGGLGNWVGSFPSCPKILPEADTQGKLAGGPVLLPLYKTVACTQPRTATRWTRRAVHSHPEPTRLPSAQDHCSIIRTGFFQINRMSEACWEFPACSFPPAYLKQVPADCDSQVRAPQIRAPPFLAYQVYSFKDGCSQLATTHPTPGHDPPNGSCPVV